MVDGWRCEAHQPSGSASGDHRPDGVIRPTYLDDDGTLLVAGASLTPGIGGFVARLKNGALDTSFHLTGVLEFPLSSPNNDGSARATYERDASGAVVSVFASVIEYLPNSTRGDQRVYRVTPQGNIDTTFNGGTGYLSFASTTINEIVWDGQGIIVEFGNGFGSCTFTRYTRAGVLDVTFGSVGTATLTAGSGASATEACVLQRTRRSIIFRSNDMSRLTPTGTLTPLYTGTGFFVKDVAEEFLNGNVLAWTESGAYNLSPDDTLDPSWATSGRYEDLNKTNAYRFLVGVGLTTNGSVMVAASDNSVYSFNVLSVRRLTP